MGPTGRACFLTLLMAAAAVAHAQSSASSPAAASAQAGDILFESRLRYEGVSQDRLDDATALTLRRF